MFGYDLFLCSWMDNEKREYRKPVVQETPLSLNGKQSQAVSVDAACTHLSPVHNVLYDSW